MMVKIGRVVGGVRCGVLGVADPNGAYIRDDIDHPILFNACIDRNGDGMIRTVRDGNDAMALDWHDFHGSIIDAEDECICVHSETAGYDKIQPAITRSGDVWIGSTTNNRVSRINGDTGEPLDPNGMVLPYMGSLLADYDDVIWSAWNQFPDGYENEPNGQVVRKDPNTTTTREVRGAWALALDIDGNIVVSAFNDPNRPIWVCRLDPNGNVIDPNLYWSGGSGGDHAVAVTLASGGDLCVADHGLYPEYNGTTISRIRATDGALTTIDLGWPGPDGVAVDNLGQVWATATKRESSQSKLLRIDPNSNTPTEVRSGFYGGTLNNMTGDVTLYATGQGTWHVISDGKKFGAKWSLLLTTGDPNCGNEDLSYDVRADDTRVGLATHDWLPVLAGKRFRTSLMRELSDPNDPNDVSPSGPFTFADIRGRFIEVRVCFHGSGPGDDFYTPKLESLIVRHGLGDANCNGVINFADINPFVLALSDPSEYQRTYPCCDVWLRDVNKDGVVNFADINPFVDILSEGSEPD